MNDASTASMSMGTARRPSTVLEGGASRKSARGTYVTARRDSANVIADLETKMISSELVGR
jgi:SLT domain-containing protein